MRKFINFAAFATLVMSSVSAQESGAEKSEPTSDTKVVVVGESVPEAKAESSATASVSIVTVDGDGKVTKKTITQSVSGNTGAEDGDKEAKSASKNIEVKQTENRLEVVLPDGTRKVIELGDVLKNRVDGVFELRLDEQPGEDGRVVQGFRIQGIPDTVKLNELLASQLSKLKETQQQIAKEQGDLAEQQAKIAAELSGKIAKAIQIEIGGEDGPQIAKFGKMFFLDDVIGDEAEVQVEVEIDAQGRPVLQSGRRIIGRALPSKITRNEPSQIEEKILDKLEAVLERLEKIEREIETLKKGE